MSNTYWDRYWQLRSSRRNFLGGAAAAGAGTAGLVLTGCGGSSSTSSTPTPTKAASGTASASSSASASGTATDHFAGAKSGGTLTIPIAGDPPTLHPYKNLSFLTKGFAAYVYSRLLRYTNIWDTAAADQTPTADAAAKWETPDSTHYTFTLRPNMKFQNTAPVNGRAITTDDIKYSWAQLTAPTSANAIQVAFVDHLEYPDSSHVTFVLKTPNADFLDLMADCNLFWVMPTESESQFDPTQKPIGSGPWIMSNYTPSSSFTFSRNPDWYDSPRPYADTLKGPIITSYPTDKSEFIAGHLDTFTPDNLDLPSVKGAVPTVQFTGAVPELLSFVYFDNKPDSPWAKDPRVRQALSMALDRNSIATAIGDASAVSQAGLKELVPWNNLIPSGMTRWWLDPQGSEMGPNAQFFKFDVAGAKQLLSAAGFPNGFSVNYQYPGADVYGTAFDTNAQANIQLWQAIGVKVNTQVQNYQSQYITQTFIGNFTGIAYGYETPFPEVGSYPTRFFTQNPLNHGHINDSQLLSLTTQQQQELDATKRKQLLFQLQQLNAAQMYYIPNVSGGVTGWGAGQSWIQGFTHIHAPGYGAPCETYPYWWSNKS